MSKLRPFDAGGWFPIHNAVFDVIMPLLSPNGWKILCVAIRQTWGWVADSDGDPRHRREWDRVSYSQFTAKSGIKSRSTVSRALKECLDSGYLLRHQVGTERGMPAYVYALNREFEIDWRTESETEPVEQQDVPADADTALVEEQDVPAATITAPGATSIDPQNQPAGDMNHTGPNIGLVQELNWSKNRTKTSLNTGPVQKLDWSKDQTVTGPKIGLVTSPKIGLTKQRKTNSKQSMDHGLSVDKIDILNQLTVFGVDEPVASRIARHSDPSDVREWLSYAQQAVGLNNPVAFVVRRLLDAEPPPADTDDAPDRHMLKTAMCPICYLVRPVQYICEDCDQCFECCTCGEEAVA